MKIAIINDTRTHDEHYGCSLVMKNLITLAQEEGGEISWTWPVGKDWRLYKEEILEKEEVDLFIVNGEGTIHHSSKKRAMPSALSEFAEFATTKLKKPSYLINATLFMNSSDVYKSLSWFEKIFVRDSNSLKELQHYKIKAQIVPDLSISNKEQEKQFTKGKRTGIGVTDSHFQDLTRKLWKMSQENGFEFMPMINCYKDSKSQPNNKAALADSDEFVQWIESKEFIITGRYHTATICIMTKTPFIALESNTPKISSLLFDIFGTNSRILYDPSIIYTDSEILKRHTIYTPKEANFIEIYLKKCEEKQKNMMRKIIISKKNTVQNIRSI